MEKLIKIYILDDNRHFGSMIKDALSNQSRVVMHFDSEIEFIRRLSDQPDVIILDHKLEHCTGLEVLEVIKRKCGSSANVIYLSAQGQLSITLKSLRNGAIEYVEKGITPLKYIENVIAKIAKHTNQFKNPINVELYRSDSTIYGA
ncbi:MAG: DNA-binding response OmpR family regulator [Crocinitomicaceae bacterium]|jgi:DNA-binding response OmpR family regulator